MSSQSEISEPLFDCFSASFCSTSIYSNPKWPANLLREPTVCVPATCGCLTESVLVTRTRLGNLGVP
ncbi:hypothetical protein L596_003075 [Steinernema carpocapsae]|uniref:Uncharacterized protein n=1 Tax=Steinernema carpocapsae TaxID=34508 RepID=A0A4U8UU94_STECR|nr:hypothetical protein L596_003075 [Steinernema carpocapsae]